MSTEPAEIRRYSRRWFLAGAAGSGLLASAGLAATAPRRAPIVLSTGTASAGLFSKLIGEWNDAHPQRPAVVEDLGATTGEQYTRMKQRAEDGWGGILHLDVIYVPEFASRGWIAELPDDLSREAILPGPLATCRRAPDDDTLYAVPFNTDVGVLFADQGLPRGVTGLRGLLGAVPDHRAQLITQLGEANEALLVNVLEHALAVEPQVLSGGALNRDAEVWTRALAPLVDAVHRERVWRGADEVAAEQRFRAGGGPYMRNWLFRGQTEKIATVLQPGVLGGQNLAVVAGSPRRDATVELLRYLTSPQSQRDLARSNLVPVDREAYADAEAVSKRLPEMLSGIEAARPRPITPHYSALANELQQRLKDYLDNPTGRPINDDTMDALVRIQDGK